MTAKTKVLWADDEKDFLEPIVCWLESQGYHVTTASNGKEVVQKAREDPPDLLFLDINMPVMDGFEALKRIRAFNKDLPIIMVSATYAYGDYSEKLGKTDKMNISGFFAKNYSLEQLTQLLHSALRTHKKLRTSSEKTVDSSREKN